MTEPLDIWSMHMLETFALVLFIGIAILFAVALAVRRYPHHGLRQYVAVLASVAIAAAVADLAARALHAWMFEVPLWEDSLDEFALDFIAFWARYTVLGMLIAGAWLYVRAQTEQTDALKQIAIDTARMDQQVAEARLQVLEAQIEPHFLFNTLAHVKRLYASDRANGARMLRNLKDYLSVALPQMREAESTLQRELEHVRAYLNIQHIRMGRRLAFALDLPEALRNVRMPPLMILTLVENAVKHGLGPARAGGRIDVRASAEDGVLRVEVADTGQGFARSTGGGTGLANIRSRLKGLFDNTAGLTLASNTPHGVVATLTLPCQPTTPRGPLS
ncbi:MAG: histidine kinase [Casimicrobiaceae bacterium]